MLSSAPFSPGGGGGSSTSAPGAFAAAVAAAAAASEAAQLRLAAVDMLVWLLHPNPDARPQTATELSNHHFFSRAARDSPSALSSSATATSVVANAPSAAARGGAGGGGRTFGGWRMSEMHVAAALGRVDEVRRLAAADAGAVGSDVHLLQKRPLHLAAEAVHAATVKVRRHGAARTDLSRLLFAARNAMYLINCKQPARWGFRNAAHYASLASSVADLSW